MSSATCRRYAGSIPRLAIKQATPSRRRMRAISRLASIAVLLAATVTVFAQQSGPPGPITAKDLLAGLPADGSAWLTFGGNYANQRHSPLTQITPANVS